MQTTLAVTKRLAGPMLQKSWMGIGEERQVSWAERGERGFKQKTPTLEEVVSGYVRISLAPYQAPHEPRAGDIRCDLAWRHLRLLVSQYHTVRRGKGYLNKLANLPGLYLLNLKMHQGSVPTIMRFPTHGKSDRIVKFNSRRLLAGCDLSND